MTAEIIVTEVAQLKDKAGIRRSRQLYADALKIYDDAITKMKNFMAGNTGLSENEKSNINYEISDCYGLIGGTHRRIGLSATNESAKKVEFKLSYESYDIGYNYEIASGKDVSYNMVQRLVSRIFFEPGSANEDSVETPLKNFVQTELVSAERTLHSQMERRTDIWGWADLSLCALLLNKIPPLTALDGFVRNVRRNKDFASFADTLKPLSALAIDAKQNIDAAILFLEKRTISQSSS